TGASISAGTDADRFRLWSVRLRHRRRPGRYRGRHPVLRLRLWVSGVCLCPVLAAVRLLLAVLTVNLLYPRPERAFRRPLFLCLVLAGASAPARFLCLGLAGASVPARFCA